MGQGINDDRPVTNTGKITGEFRADQAGAYYQDARLWRQSLAKKPVSFQAVCSENWNVRADQQ